MGYKSSKDFENKPCTYCLWTIHDVVHICFKENEVYEPNRGGHEWVDVWLWPKECNNLESLLSSCWSHGLEYPYKTWTP